MKGFDLNRVTEFFFFKFYDYSLKMHINTKMCKQFQEFIDLSPKSIHRLNPCIEIYCKTMSLNEKYIWKMILKGILAVAFGTKQLDIQRLGCTVHRGKNIDRKHKKGRLYNRPPKCLKGTLGVWPWMAPRWHISVSHDTIQLFLKELSPQPIFPPRRVAWVITLL